jgi:ATP-binding cassette subfamily B protein
MGQTRSHVQNLAQELRLIASRAGEAWRLISWRHRWALGSAGLLMALTSACNTAVPLALGQLIDHVTPIIADGGDPSAGAIPLYLGAIAAAYVLREAFNLLRRRWVESACTQIDRDMTVRVISHLLQAELTQLSREKTGALQTRVSRSVDGLVQFVRLGFLLFLPAVVTGLFALVATLYHQPLLALIMAGVIPLSVLLTLWQLVSQKGVRLELMRTREEIDGTLAEQLAGIDYVRAADTHQHEVGRVAGSAERRRSTELRHHFQMSLFGAAKALNEGLFHILVLGFGVWLAVNGHISVGEILTFSVLFLNVMTPLAEIHRVIDEGHERSLQVGDLLQLLAKPSDPSFATAPGAAPRLEPGAPVLELHDLGLEYSTVDGQQKRALDGVSLEIRHGETVGIAGRSGCGKSSWLKVVLRLAHPNAGSGRLGGVNLQDVSRQTIGELVGYVGQSPFIFAGTIAENIAYGCNGVAREQIEEAARRADLHYEILELPGGYDSLVTERGQNLSGGQRQRLALARVLLKNPPIMILDEGTSALDTISERHVQRALEETRGDRTIILVAHRLSTLRDADRIFVFDEGRVVEVGSYDELAQRGGVFSALVQSAAETATGMPSTGA